MLPIRNITYLSPMCCDFCEKCINSQKIVLGCSSPLKYPNMTLLIHEIFNLEKLEEYDFFFVLFCFVLFWKVIKNDSYMKYVTCKKNTNIWIISWGCTSSPLHFPRFTSFWKPNRVSRYSVCFIFFSFLFSCIGSTSMT